MKTVLALLCLALGACASEYAPESLTGGFADTRLAPDSFLISSRGNIYTSPERTRDFALRRAAELTLKAGYTHFAIVSGQSGMDVRSAVIPGEAVTTSSGYATAAVGGGYGYGTATSSSRTTYTGPQEFTTQTPRTNLAIRCFKGKPAGGFAFDAAFIDREMRAKYPPRQ